VSVSSNLPLPTTCVQTPVSWLRRAFPASFARRAAAVRVRPNRCYAVRIMLVNICALVFVVVKLWSKMAEAGVAAKPCDMLSALTCRPLLF
jgi:hypothetical protein